MEPAVTDVIIQCVIGMDLILIHKVKGIYIVASILHECMGTAHILSLHKQIKCKIIPLFKKRPVYQMVETIRLLSCGALTDVWENNRYKTECARKKSVGRGEAE